LLCTKRALTAYMSASVSLRIWYRGGRVLGICTLVILVVNKVDKYIELDKVCGIDGLSCDFQFELRDQGLRRLGI
jgi:hypothetical protein